MTWGTKIVVVFSLFVAGMLYMVVKSSRQNIDLVVPDYYEQELKYQDVIDARVRTQALSEAVSCKVKDDSISVVFPKEMRDVSIKGELWLYCIADKRKDMKQEFSANTGTVHIPINALNKGLHEVKISWQVNGLSYYHNQKLFIQ